MNFLPLKNLTPACKQATILVRVSRMWNYRGGTDDGDIQHVDMVLIDEEGTGVYAKIGSKITDTKKQHLVEGGVYVFKRFVVAGAKKSYRPVDFKFMINITYHAIIELCPTPPPALPLYVYRLTRFSDLPAVADNTTSFVDVIAMISEVGEVETFYRRFDTKPGQKRLITIKDARETEMNLVLWGHKAVEFPADEICTMSGQQPAVAIFVGLLVRSFRGDVSLSANAAARWYFNLDVPEVRMFLSCLKTDLQPITRIPLDPAATAASDEPLPEPELRSLAEIKDTNPSDFPKQGFRCTMTLSMYKDNQGWWFPSCKRCNKTCSPDGSGYKCPEDQCTSFKFKYKPCYVGTDGTAEAEFVFFHEVGRSLVGKEIKQLMRSSGSSTNVPSEMAAQIGQKYQLTIHVTNRAYHSSDYAYDVKRIDFSYGRQPEIPTVRNLRDKHVADKNVPLIKHGESSSVPATQQQLQLVPNTTPPPAISPIKTPSSTDDSTSDKTKLDPEKTIARRPLFKDDQEMDDEDPTESSSDDDDTVKDQHLDDSDKTRRGEGRKARPLKKARKN